ncbi:hypothetical protein GWK91_03100 [Virgibacillus sp. MSP4-1]|uniref:hypothetical protein n=1 Tax=Virgibacillus sp. MSP4-1 TaxID=2700081 RepID=UPI0003A90BE7|nr:hypothetical protein [Virgibacillus sp. MSP4-1]QHS21991.1 hypothetical protein GWK91_03100 [Virgibacillus sp. MSP4-1]
MIKILKRSALFLIPALVIAFGISYIINDNNANTTVVKGDNKNPKTSTIRSIFDVDTSKMVKNAINEYQKLQSNNPDFTVQLHNKTIDINDKKMRKWIIREYIDSSLITGSPVTGSVLLQNAANSYTQRNAIFKYAREEFGVKVNRSDVRKHIDKQVEFIENNQKQKEFFTELANDLDLTKKQFFYKWEFDNFAEQVVAQKVYPILEKENPQKENESLNEYKQRLQDIFMKGLNEFIKK